MTATPRAARAVMGAVAACALGGAGLLLGAGAADAAAPAVVAVPVGEPARPGAGTTASSASPGPGAFSFDGMSPGQTRSTIVDLDSRRESDGRVVEVRVTADGELGPSLSTSVDACFTAWQGDVCPGGAVRLVEGWRAGQQGPSVQEVALPAGTTTSLRVEVTLDDDVLPGATGNLWYDLALQGDGRATPRAEDPADPRSPGGSPASGPTGGDAPSDGAAHTGEPLAITGASVWQAAALAGGLIGVGAALLRRRRPRPACAEGNRRNPHPDQTPHQRGEL
jgi:hypothetical protein